MMPPKSYKYFFRLSSWIPQPAGFFAKTTAISYDIILKSKNGLRFSSRNFSEHTELGILSSWSIPGNSVNQHHVISTQISNFVRIKKYSCYTQLKVTLPSNSWHSICSNDCNSSKKFLLRRWEGFILGSKILKKPTASFTPNKCSFFFFF